MSSDTGDNPGINYGYPKFEVVAHLVMSGQVYRARWLGLGLGI